MLVVLLYSVHVLHTYKSHKHRQKKEQLLLIHILKTNILDNQLQNKNPNSSLGIFHLARYACVCVIVIVFATRTELTYLHISVWFSLIWYGSDF